MTNEFEKAWREVTDADLVCALALVTFAGAQVTLRHDRDPIRRAAAIANTFRAVDGLTVVCQALRTVAASDLLAKVSR